MVVFRLASQEFGRWARFFFKVARTPRSLLRRRSRDAGDSFSALPLRRAGRRAEHSVRDQIDTLTHYVGAQMGTYQLYADKRFEMCEARCVSVEKAGPPAAARYDHLLARADGAERRADLAEKKIAALEAHVAALEAHVAALGAQLKAPSERRGASSEM